MPLDDYIKEWLVQAINVALQRAELLPINDKKSAIILKLKETLEIAKSIN